MPITDFKEYKSNEGLLWPSGSSASLRRRQASTLT